MIELLPNRLLTSFWEGGGAPKMFPRIPTNWFLGPFYRVTAFYHWSYTGRNVRPMDVENTPKWVLRLYMSYNTYTSYNKRLNCKTFTDVFLCRRRVVPKKERDDTW